MAQSNGFQQVERMAKCNRCGSEMVAWVTSARTGRAYLVEANRNAQGAVIAQRFNFHSTHCEQNQKARSMGFTPQTLCCGHHDQSGAWMACTETTGTDACSCDCHDLPASNAEGRMLNAEIGAVAVLFDGPYPTQGRGGDEVPEWTVCLGDEDGEPIENTTVRYSSYSAALSVAQSIARASALELVCEGHPA